MAPSHRKYAARSRSFRVIANHLIFQLMIVGGLEVPVNKPLPGQPVTGLGFTLRIFSTLHSPSNYSLASRNPTEGKDRESPLDPVSSRQDVRWFLVLMMSDLGNKTIFYFCQLEAIIPLESG